MDTAEQPQKSDENLPVAVERKGITLLPPAPRIDLSNYRDIRLEMGRVYRLYDQGKMSETDAKARHYMLATLAQLIKATETEQRLEAIERAMGLRRTEQARSSAAGLPPFGRGFSRRR